MQSHSEDTPRRPLSTITPAVRPKLYHTSGQKGGPNWTINASDQTVITMDPVKPPTQYIQPHQGLPPWNVTPSTMLYPSDEPKYVPAGHCLVPSVPTPPESCGTPVQPRQMNTQGAGDCMQTPVITSHVPIPAAHVSMAPVQRFNLPPGSSPLTYAPQASGPAHPKPFANCDSNPISYPMVPQQSYGMCTWSTSESQQQTNHMSPPPTTQSPGHVNTLGPQVASPIQAPSLPQMATDRFNTVPPALSSHTGFTQMHQVKNVQVFSGGAECRILIEDWIRDMQYLLDAGGLPSHLSFATIVRHLSGEARKLVLNLPPSEQLPERAFDELRAEYGDMQRSLDPLADFYERTQRSGETACSFAIALEATLREVEDAQNRGQPFLDRDAKLVRQFIRGLTDEEVYIRVAPMKPRLLSFRDLQVELRNLARETKRFNPQHKQKKAFSQVQTAGNKPRSGSSDRTDAGKHNSEISELAALVKGIAMNQEEQCKRLAQLESKFNPAPSSFRSNPGNRDASRRAAVVCHRCGRPGHLARSCRTVLPDGEPPATADVHAAVMPDGSAPAGGQSLNS